VKTVKIQLAPTKSQQTLLLKQLEEHRQLYNNCLSKKIQAWKGSSKNLTGFDLIKSEIPPLKQSGCLSNYSSLQQTVRRLEKAYKRFFANGGFPRFKNADRFNTVEFSKRGDGWQIRDNKTVYIQGVGEIRCLSPRFPGEAKSMSVSRCGSGWFVNIGYEYAGDDADSIPESHREIGIDMGLKTFVAMSDGSIVKSPKELKRSLKEVGKLHRRIHKAVKGSVQRLKHKRSLKKLHKKIANRRRDFNHKLSRKIVNENRVIVVEKLHVKNIVARNNGGGKRNINRAYSDVAWGQFRQFLSYKAENAGRILVEVNPAYTTQECSSCGKVEQKDLSDREHQCECGCTLDRDVNAAKNILRRGLASLCRASA
jgi:putative transposase